MKIDPRRIINFIFILILFGSLIMYLLFNDYEWEYYEDSKAFYQAELNKCRVFDFKYKKYSNIKGNVRLFQTHCSDDFYLVQFKQEKNPQTIDLYKSLCEFALISKDSNSSIAIIESGGNNLKVTFETPKEIYRSQIKGFMIPIGVFFIIVSIINFTIPKKILDQTP
jgi:hypothetical protein